MAEADYWPCPVKTDKTLTQRDFDSEDPEATKTIEVWEVRIWLNRAKVEDELDIECSAESPAIPLEDQDTSTTTSTTQNTLTPQNSNNNGGVQQDTVNTNAPASNTDHPPTGDKSTQTPSNSDPSSTSRSTPTSDSNNEPTQPSVSTQGNEEEQQSSPPTPGTSDKAEDDLLQTEDDDSSDLMEIAEEQSDDDLMEQAGPTTSASQDDEKPQESEATTQTTRPRVPRTGTGGTADIQSDDGLSRGLAPFVASVAAIGIVSLALYRRIRRAQSR